MKPLLAKSWHPTMDPTGWWVSEKLDGVRALWDGTSLLTRTSKTIHAPDWFKAKLPNRALDGELWLARGAFQELVSIVRRRSPDDRWLAVKYMVFDSPTASGPFEDRFLGLPNTPPVVRVEHISCLGRRHLESMLSKVQSDGGEGLMLRQPRSSYVQGRSGTLLKVKTFQDAEAIVVGYTEGKGKHLGRVGALIVTGPEGELFEVGTGLDDVTRGTPPPLGSVITYKYQGLTDAGRPRFPVFMRVRGDIDL